MIHGPSTIRLIYKKVGNDITEFNKSDLNKNYINDSAIFKFVGVIKPDKKFQKKTDSKFTICYLNDKNDDNGQSFNGIA